MTLSLHTSNAGRHTGAVTRGALMAVCMGISAASQAALTFDFDYSDNSPGVGFLDPVAGAARQAALVTAGDLFSDLFGSHFSNMATITLKATSSFDTVSGVLASAGSEIALYGVGTFGGGEVVRNKLLTGVDLNGADADGTVDVNFGEAWQLDPNAAVGPADFDFYAALFHEFTHALGFSSQISEDGSPPIGPKNDGEWGKFDEFLVDENDNRIVSDTFALDQATWDTAKVGGTSPVSGLFFNGPNAVAANGGNLVGLFSPTTWVDGSSGSHLDTDNPEFSTSMMKDDRDFGPEARTYSAVEVGMLLDLGYSAVTAVPEPSMVALLVAGFGMLAGASARRRA